jgi:hypothetical protein
VQSKVRPDQAQDEEEDQVAAAHIHRAETETRVILFGVYTATAGSPSFFRPRIPNPWFHLHGTIEATSYYDTRPLSARPASPRPNRPTTSMSKPMAGAVISSQNSRNQSTRLSGALPAMMAVLMAPIEMPTTQSG